MAVSNVMDLWPFGRVGRLEIERNVTVGSTGECVTKRRDSLE